MELSTAKPSTPGGPTPRESIMAKSSGSRTIADMMAMAAEKYGDTPALRVKRDGGWSDFSFAQVNSIVTEIGLGLMDLGVEAGERVCILANTRAEWTYADFAIASIGAVKVTIYPTNTPTECEWVAGDSEAVAIVCEDASQVAKIAQVRERLPHLRYIIAIDPAGETGDAIALEAIRERGRAHDRGELEERYSAITPEDPYTFIYTSGTTGPPKGCVLTHANYRRVIDMCHTTSVLRRGEVTYLYLPLAHAFALLVQLLAIDGGGTIAYWSGDPQKIVPELQETSPSYFPSVPRIFEKIYTLATAAVQKASPEDQERFREAVQLGVRVRDLLVRGERVPAELEEPFAQAEEQLYRNVRAIFGGNIRQAVTGAAPIAPAILEFFYACGVPVLEGYGMTETATVATYSNPEHHRFGTVGRALPGCEIKIADDGEVLIKGPNIFTGYYKNDDASFGAVRDGWLHTGDLGSLDEDGYLSIIGRKKDIIITAGGKNLTPANIENDLKQCRWVSQAVMHGDRRPYPVMLITLDEEEIRQWAQERGKPEAMAKLSRDPDVRSLIQAELDRANTKYAGVEQVKRFVILDHDLAQESGELTPTLKVKRNVVNDKYAELFDSLYES
jgi:long-chain acyl-CoA synthetase